MTHENLWLEATKETLAGYRRLIDAAICQLSDQQFFERLTPDTNSVAILLRHLGGNLESRWRNFLTEDGEKDDRDRDREFEDWPDSRDALLAYFDAGWNRLHQSLDSLSIEDMSRTVQIRGEPHSVPQAIQRSLTHTSYHVGQLLMIARLVHRDADRWRWLTVKPQGSREHNATTWGTSSSRGVAGGGSET